MERKKVLLMYSGGLDSILSMARLVLADYKVLLVHFDNGCSKSIGLEVDRALYFQSKQGKDAIEYVGKITTVPEFRNNIRAIANIPFSEMIKRYGDTTYSQLQCLNCRAAMYYEAIKFCEKNDIHFIAEGARKSQLFAIEQPQVIEVFRRLLAERGIELLLPLYEDDNDFSRESELIMYGIAPIPSEEKCLLGMPLDEKVAEEHTRAIARILEEEIVPRYIKELKSPYRPPQGQYFGRGSIPFD